MLIQNDLSSQPIGRIMSSRLVTVEMDDTLSVVQSIFRKVKFHHLLVVDQGKLVGIISDRDLLKAVSPYVGTLSETTRDLATLSKRAHQIMSRHPVTIGPGSTVQEAARLMIKRGVSCLPVLTSDGMLLGVITWKDLLKAFCNFVP